MEWLLKILWRKTVNDSTPYGGYDYCQYCNRYHLIGMPCPYSNYGYVETFNYECPDCHGKFNKPSPCYNPLGWQCPFCAKQLKGYVS